MSVSTPQKKSGFENKSHAGDDASTTDHMAQAAHATVDKAAANLAQAERALREAQIAAGTKVSDMSEQARQMGSESLSSVRKYVDQYPVRSVGIAFATGYLLSVILKK